MYYPHIVIIDPGLKIPETDVFNSIVSLSSLPCSYHLPGIADVSSLGRENIDFVRGIIVLGGGASLTDPISWRLALESWFQKCLLKQIPVLAVAWGHQWIAHQFGGKIGLIPSISEKIKGFRKFCIEACEPFESSNGLLAYSHRAMVVDAPREASCFVTSDLLDNEGLVYQSSPIFTFQAHPEATAVYMKNGNYPESCLKEDLTFGTGLMQQFLDWAASKSSAL